jgi:predicted ATP-binding protein involved in virulence
MKIRKLHIKNYKVFDDIELDFTDANGKTLNKIVLAGVNGCGKTTVLDIIYKLCDATLSEYIKSLKNSSINIEIEIEITDNERERGLQYTSTFIEKSIKQGIKGDFEYIRNIFDVGNNIKTVFNLNNNDPKVESIIYNLLKKTINKSPSTGLYYMPVHIANRTITYKKNNIELISLNSDKDKMKELALKDLKDEILKNRDQPPGQTIEKTIKRITKALESLFLTTKLTDLESEELIFESANGQRIKFEDLSNGEQNLYFRAIYLSTLNPQNSIIMIDEPEDSLHPTWQQKVMQLYQNIGENNQVIVATHSPHIIGSSKAEEVFLLQIDAHQIEARHPKYTKGHSIDYVLDEIMGANSRDTSVINLVDSYLALMRKGLHESEEGMKIKANIDALNLDPNSEEMRGLNLSIKRIKAVGV